MKSIGMRLNRLYLLLFAFALCVEASGKVILVHPQKGVTTIRKALESAVAGDTVIVTSGLYREGELVVTVPLCLIADGEVVLDGEKKYNVLLVKSGGVTIRGFHIRNSGYNDLRELAGIRLENARFCLIEKNILYDNYFGIYLANSNNCVIKGNRVEGFAKTESSSGNGIHLWKSSHVMIDSNFISGHRDGIYFEFVKESIVNRNISERCLRYGLHFMFSDADSYSFNEFCYNGSGVAVMYTRHVIMRYNRFHHNWGGAAYGLLLKEIGHSVISYNHFNANTSGLYMEGSNSIVVAHNEFTRNGWSLRMLGDCFDNSILSNNFIANTFDMATNAIRNMNRISGNYWDHYRGYDMNRDGTGDVPFHTVSFYSKLTEDAPYSLMMLHSFLIDILDQTEKVVPSITPAEFRDDAPKMKKIVHR